MISISFCISHKSRLHQLKQTLPVNLKHLPNDCEVVISNLDGTKQLLEWAASSLQEFILSDQLKIFDVSNISVWSSPIAKNIAHRIAGGQYLFNLDADNFVDPKDIQLIRQAAQQNAACMQWSGSWIDGSFGRIGLPNETFKIIGGYDDTLLPMGAQDLDLIKRLAALGVEVLDFKGPTKAALVNDFSAKVGNIIQHKGRDPESLWEEMNRINIQIIEFKLKNFGPIRKNPEYVVMGELNSTPMTLVGSNIFRNNNPREFLFK